MKDPERLVDQHPSALAKSLLGAAIDEEPSVDLLGRTLGMLAATGASIGMATGAAHLASGGAPEAASAAGAASTASLAPTATATATATATSAGLLATTVKWVGIASIGGALVAAAGRGLSGSASPTTVRAPVTDGRRAPATAVMQAARPELAPAAPPSALPVVATPPLERARSVATPVAPEPSAASVLLAQEANLIDHAREAIAAGDGMQALRLLEAHRHKFDQPRLQPEALYLRMQALRLMGNEKAAARVAARLLEDYPDGPESASARALLKDARR